MSTYFTEEHEWIAVEGETATVGITAHAAEQLGDVVFVEVSDVGTSVEKGGECGTIESVKAASEIYSPAGGEILEVNAALEDNPGLVNESPEGEAWLYKMKLADPGELESLMDRAAYEALIA